MKAQNAATNSESIQMVEDGSLSTSSSSASPHLERERYFRVPAASKRPLPALPTDLKSNGYHVFRSALPSRLWFNRIYDSFDQLENMIQARPSILADWLDTVSEWQSENDSRAYYCHVPPVFKDRSHRFDKRDKAYIQYCLDFAVSRAFVHSSLSRVNVLKTLFDQLQELHFICVAMFSRSIAAISECDGIDLGRILQPPDRIAPVVIKLIRYNPNPRRFATNPHYDKSALSLLLHSDDAAVSFRLGRYSENLRFRDLVSPIQYPRSESDPNHGVLIVGSCLREAGYPNYQPSPHAVLPVARETARHAIVAFHLVPGLKGTELLDTDVEFVNDYDNSVT